MTSPLDQRDDAAVAVGAHVRVDRLMTDLESSVAGGDLVISNDDSFLPEDFVSVRDCRSSQKPAGAPTS